MLRVHDYRALPQKTIVSFGVSLLEIKGAISLKSKSRVTGMVVMMYISEVSILWR